MDVRKEIQENPVGAEVSALYAVVRPILTALLLSLRDEVVRDYEGHHNILLRQLPGIVIRMMGSQASASSTLSMMPLSTEIPKSQSVSVMRFTGTAGSEVMIPNLFFSAPKKVVE